MASSKAAALREAFAAVSCPICTQSVEACFINKHIDSGCHKHGAKRPHQAAVPAEATDGVDGAQIPKRQRRGAPLGSEDVAAAVGAVPSAVPLRTFALFGGQSQRRTAAEMNAETELARCFTSQLLLSLPRARLYPLVPSGRSWVLHVPAWCRMPPASFDALWAQHPENHATVVLFGQQVTCSRYTKMYGRDYIFSGQRTATAGPLSVEGCGPELMAAFEQVCALAAPHENQNENRRTPGIPNGVLVNWYADGSHYVRTVVETLLLHYIQLYT